MLTVAYHLVRPGYSLLETPTRSCHGLSDARLGQLPMEQLLPDCLYNLEPLVLAGTCLLGT